MRNKIKHILAGLAVSFWCGVPAYVNDHALFSAIWAALWSGIIAAGIKEYWDSRTPGNEWSWSDFGYTMIGVAVAVLIILALHFGRG